jgi:hypothetical protein
METGTQTSTGNNNGSSGVTALEQLHDRGFGGDTFMLALALGREEDQIKDILSGVAEMDDDLEIKVRGIAQERNIEIDQ